MAMAHPLGPHSQLETRVVVFMKTCGYGMSIRVITLGVIISHIQQADTSRVGTG